MTRVRDIQPDPEFDSLLGGEQDERMDKYLLSLSLPHGSYAGITLAPTTPEVRLGHVRVKQLDRRDRAYICGLREGDILLCMDGQPCLEHDLCIQRIEEVTHSGTEGCIDFIRIPHSTIALYDNEDTTYQSLSTRLLE